MRIRSTIVLLGLLVAPLSACSFSIGQKDEKAVETDANSDSETESTTRKKKTTTTDEEASDTTAKKKKKAAEPDEAELEASVAAALQTNLAGAGGGSSSDITDEESACMAQGMIKELGAERVIELGLEDSGDLVLTSSEADAVIPILKTCLDFNGLIAKGILEEAGDSLSEKSALCVAEGFGKTSFVDDVLKAELTGGSADASLDALSQEAQAELITVFTTCLTPEEFAAFANS